MSSWRNDIVIEYALEGKISINMVWLLLAIGQDYAKASSVSGSTVGKDWACIVRSILVVW
jgi:hypothetical protein